jgi:D-serine deaminase-like pyridoxal phosphate-dependent protein
MISLRAESDLRVGDTLRIIPNHVCGTVNLHDALFLTGEDGIVKEVPVAARGKVW